jgi:signal transduction histidine kinase
MNRAASQLIFRLIVAQLVVGSLAMSLAVAFSSRLLLFDMDLILATLPLSGGAAVFLALYASLGTLLITARLRPCLRAIAAGGTDIHAGDLLSLYALPAKLTLFDAAGALAVGGSSLLRPLRPPTSDVATQGWLVVLAMTFGAAAILPAYILMRAQVSRVLEAAPLSLSREALGLVADRLANVPRVPRRFIFAVAAPIVFVAAGASLLVQAHVRAFETEAREDEAQKLATAALDVVGIGGLGRAAAITVAAEHGLHVTLKPNRAPFHVIHDDEGVTAMQVPLEDGHAELSFATTELRPILWVYALLGVIATVLAGLLGSRTGQWFVTDLGIATRAVRETGAADVIRGSRVRREARFDSVTLLMDAIDSLGGVFREFASAQERAIDARAATERMRGLFLASMSHDLKGPLNAVLGFAELVSKSPLTAAQQESLTIIEQRGRELLTLIQTILDSARVEAGELHVTPEWTMVGDVVMSAVLDARDASAGSDVEIVGEIQPRVPQLYVDGTRMVQALTAVIQSAVRFTVKGVVHVRATLPAGSTDLRLDVESAGRTAPSNERDRIFDAFKDPDRARRHGSLGLGLALARSIIELHGGSIDVVITKEGETVFHMVIPTEAERVIDSMGGG